MPSRLGGLRNNGRSRAGPGRRVLRARGREDPHLVAKVETALPGLGGAGPEGATDARDRRGLDHAFQSDRGYATAVGRAALLHQPGSQRASAGGTGYLTLFVCFQWWQHRLLLSEDDVA
eukprot:3207573-Pyramimonas_sp.AAC.1